MHHRTLLKKIETEAHEIFEENIRWLNENLPGENGQIRPDLIGVDANGNYVIVEVKSFDHIPQLSQYYKPREAVGQVLHYATAYVQKYLKCDPRDVSDKQLIDEVTNVRMFIVGDVYSEAVEKMCKFLKAHGININYISLDCI